MNHRLRSRCLALTVALGLAACSTVYEPRYSPRIALVLDNGAPALVKRGKHTPLGLFGGALIDTVADDPAALELAEEFHSRNAIGFVAAMIGIAAIAATPVVLAASNCAGPRCEDPDRTPALATALGGTVVLYFGLLYGMSSQPYLYDAINLYNDHASELPPDPVTPTVLR